MYATTRDQGRRTKHQDTGAARKRERRGCEILTGKPPYVAPDKDAVLRKALRADPADAFGRLQRCGADDELVALARRCLGAEPEDRPKDAGALAAEVTAYLDGVQVPVQAG